MHAMVIRSNRIPQIATAILVLVMFASSARADIFQWEYINPADSSQGKQQSTMLAPDGAGVDAVPGAGLGGLNLTMAYLIHADVRDASFYAATLTDADFTGTRIQDASFGKRFWCCGIPGITEDYSLRGTGITPAQLYSTTSYQTHDLSGIDFGFNELAGGNFALEHLANVSFEGATLTGADFTAAEIRGANFAKFFHPGIPWTSLQNILIGTGITLDQLYSTASYQSHDLSRVNLQRNNLAGGNFT